MRFPGATHLVILVDSQPRQASNLISFTVDPSLNGYSGPRSMAFSEELNRKLSAIPGVQLGTVFQGVLCSDRFSAYLKYHKGKAQFAGRT